MLYKNHFLITLTLIFSCSNTFSVENLPEQLAQEQPTVFTQGWDSKFCGDNKFFMYVIADIVMTGSPELPKTHLIKVTKDQNYEHKGTLGELKKTWRNKESIYESIKKHIEYNNAVFCPYVTLENNRDNIAKVVGALIYGTQETNHCEKIRENFNNIRNHQKLIQENNGNVSIVPTVAASLETNKKCWKQIIINNSI